MDDMPPTSSERLSVSVGEGQACRPSAADHEVSHASTARARGSCPHTSCATLAKTAPTARISTNTVSGVVPSPRAVLTTTTTMATSVRTETST